MNHELKIVPTADGSNTIFNSEVGENYHSRHGALQESRHVFLNSGLKHFIEHNQKVLPLTSGEDLGGAGAAISILEVGFGAGLNFLLTADYCLAENIHLDYTGIEAYPLSEEMISQTGYQQYISPVLWQQFIINYPASLRDKTKLILPTANRKLQTEKDCTLQIANCKLLNFQSDKQYDVIYFDAFAAANQPEMWNEAAISHTIGFLKPGGVFVTYAITGNLKRIVKSLGLKVEKAPGAPGKREMLRAIRYADE
jgi:tRNA U34 5-methylaminomethyl-2-thiouridine-forming methyltransferase MnmC